MWAAAASAANAQVSVDLSGAEQCSRFHGLGIATSSIAGGGTKIGGNTVVWTTLRQVSSLQRDSGVYLSYQYRQRRQPGHHHHSERRDQRTERHPGDRQPEYGLTGLRHYGVHRQRRYASVRGSVLVHGERCGSSCRYGRHCRGHGGEQRELQPYERHVRGFRRVAAALQPRRVCCPKRDWRYDGQL